MKTSVKESITASQRVSRFAFLVFGLAVFSGNAWPYGPAAQVRQLPDGPGKAETQKLCSHCHELDKSFSLSQDRAGWQNTIKKMVGFGMKGTDEEHGLILEYLVRNYPADDVPKLDVNKADAIEFESGLSLKRSQASAIIQYREKNGPFKSIEDLKKVPGIDVEKVEAKKDRLMFKQ